MTKATFYQNSRQQCVGFDVYDHAGQADAGEDIVCAAISALVINTINSIETFADDPFTVDTDEQNASISLRIQGEPSHDAQLLLNSLILGIQRMEDDEQYSDFIDMIFEEV